jgi:hypothetical protein
MLLFEYIGIGIVIILFLFLLSYIFLTLRSIRTHIRVFINNQDAILGVIRQTYSILQKDLESVVNEAQKQMNGEEEDEEDKTPYLQ